MHSAAAATSPHHRRHEPAEQLVHAPVVIALPVHARAAAASSKHVPAVRHRRRQSIEHLRLVDRLQRHVAVQAQRERPRLRRELQSLDDLAQLLRRLQRMHVAAVRDVAALQQVAVARQDRAVFVAGARADLDIGKAVVVQRVEPEHAQQPREPAEVRVGDEARHAQRLRAHAQQRRDVEAFEHRIDADAIAVAHAIPEAHRDAVGDDQLDLGVRHADRLDRVLHRRRTRASELELAPPPLRRHEIVQLLIKPKTRNDHAHTGDGGCVALRALSDIAARCRLNARN